MRAGSRFRVPYHLCGFCQRFSSSKSSDGAKASKKVFRWRPIPVALGIASLGALQLYKIRKRHWEEQVEAEKPQKRQRQRPDGPWQVQVMSTLPLKSISRIWGRFNELTIPVILRKPGFLLYSWIFGVNLSEMENPDLSSYPNLASFFYRTLKPGVRPLDSNPLALLSPADGRVLQYGMIERGEVAQVKGIKYRLDALLGADDEALLPTDDGEVIHADEEFARVNGISYTLPNLLSGNEPSNSFLSKLFARKSAEQFTDASTFPKASSEAQVGAEFARAVSSAHTALYYCVIYLAPGDYHRFHSPAAWVVERRRHFAGELYSVSPYLQRTLPGLFTLNERVVLLGRWRWGFFSFCPVGATNVGSIKLDFDRELRTNSLTTDTAADRAAAAAAERGEAFSGFAEATYAGASKILGGHALQRGEEMGGFQLGSSIVLVFEAPRGRRNSFDEGYREETTGGWRWAVETGQRVRMGESLGALAA